MGRSTRPPLCSVTRHAPMVAGGALVLTRRAAGSGPAADHRGRTDGLASSRLSVSFRIADLPVVTDSRQ